MTKLSNNNVNKTEKWQWYAGSDDEYYQEGPFDSKDQAIEIVIDEGDHDNGFHIIEATCYEINFSAKKLIEDQYLEMEDLFSRDRCQSGRLGNHEEADKKLQILLDNWISEYKSTFIEPDMFAKTRNQEFIDAQTIQNLKNKT